MIIPALMTALVGAGVDTTEVTVADFSKCVKAGACSAAERCLDWPGCKATAQPTRANARCFLFGAETKIVKNKGWNNVEVCWKN